MDNSTSATILPFAVGNFRTRWYGAAFFLFRERVRLLSAIDCLPPQVIFG
jgi:hypothetical protein